MLYTKVCKFYAEKGYLYKQAIKCHLCIYICLTDQIIMQRGDHMKLNFEGLKLQKRNIRTDRPQRVDEKLGHLSCYHVYFQGYGHCNVKSSSFLLC